MASSSIGGVDIRTISGGGCIEQVMELLAVLCWCDDDEGRAELQSLKAHRAEQRRRGQDSKRAGRAATRARCNSNSNREKKKGKVGWRSGKRRLTIGGGVSSVSRVCEPQEKMRRAKP